MYSKADHTDDQLIVQIQKGNKLAFKILFDKYGQRLFQFSLKYLRDRQDAEDLLNEVFLKVWENRKMLKTNTSFQSYLFTIAYNNIRQRFLKKSREEKYIQVFAEKYIHDHDIEEDRLDFTLFLKKMDQVLELLPPRRREIFVLSYKKELKNKEIAMQLGLSEQFVKNQLSIAKKFVIKKINEDDHLAAMLLLYLFTDFILPKK